MTALALFDFDGTLCKQDSFTGFMQSAVPKHYFYRKCLKISPQIAAYYLKLYPANRMRPLLFKTVLKDENADQAHIVGQHYAQYLVEHCLNQEVLARLKWHQHQQHQVVIVSASLNLYLQPVAKLLNVELICTQVDDYHQVLTGAYRSADCSCEEKVSRLKQHYDLQAFTKIYAYGNSHEDIHMLKLATHAYWINQKHQLQPFSK